MPFKVEEIFNDSGMSSSTWHLRVLGVTAKIRGEIRGLGRVMGLVMDL